MYIMDNCNVSAGSGQATYVQYKDNVLEYSIGALSFGAQRDGVLASP